MGIGDVIQRKSYKQCCNLINTYVKYKKNWFFVAEKINDLQTIWISLSYIKCKNEQIVLAEINVHVPQQKTQTKTHRYR